MALTMVQQCKAWFEAGLDDNAQLYHKLYHEPCDHSAINLLCAQCVPFYFAIKRSNMIGSNTSDAARATINGLGTSVGAGATACAGASTIEGAGAQESPVATMEKAAPALI